MKTVNLVPRQRMVVKRHVVSPSEEGRSVVRETLPQIIAVCAKNVLLLGFGMTLGFPTILIPNLSGNYPEEKIRLGEESISWIGSINLICVPVGCLMSGAITQPLGRKRAMQMVNIPFLTAWLLFHFSSEAWHIYLGLCITGITGGLLEAPVLTYVAEITQPHLRGILSSTSSMGVMLGILSQFLLGTFFFWRTVVLVNCSIPIISFILLMFVPESPVWLISKKRLDEARKSIAWLRGWVSLDEIEDEFQELSKQVIQIESNGHSNAVLVEEKKEGANHMSKFKSLKLFTKKNFYWPYFVVSLSFFLGHFSGNTPLQIYAIKIFTVLKTPIDKYYATVLLGTVQLLGCLMCVIFVNIIGKRLINFISLLGSGICFIIVASYAYVIDVKYFDNSIHTNATNNITNLESTVADTTSEEYRWVPMTFLVISAFLSYIGIKILPWILTGEVYSTETRATASGLSGGIGYIFGFISNKIFFTLVSCFTLPGVFLFYAFISLIGTVCLYLFLPETEGKTLFEITEHFSGRHKLSNSVGRNRRGKLTGQSNAAFEPENCNGHNESRL